MDAVTLLLSVDRKADPEKPAIVTMRHGDHKLLLLAIEGIRAMQQFQVEGDVIFEIPRQYAGVISSLRAEGPAVAIIDQASSAGSLDLILAVVGVSLTTFQIIEHFLSANREKRDILVNLKGRKYPLSEIESLEITGKADEEHFITIKIRRDNGA